MAAASRNLICLLDYSPEQIRAILDLAKDLKRGRHHDEPQVMRGKTGVLLFEKPSLRTRITFETAIYELGGHALNLDSGMVQMGKRESVEDVARNLGRWVHLVVVRTFSHATLTNFAKSCTVPVINALTDSFHPCQALAFALTMNENLGGTGRKVKVAFVGDGNNVCSSLMIVCAKLGWNFTLACPKGYSPPEWVVRECAAATALSGGSVSVVHDPAAAVAGASAVYTDVWTSMGQEGERGKRLKDFLSFQINAALMAKAPPDALVSHCLPAHRGEEISSEVLDGPNSRAFDEAENRLHVQKAVIVHLFS
jgi:ornithine carbamoyltransferase